MTTTEKLAEVKREFARAGHDVEVSLEKPVCWWDYRCERCGRRRPFFVRINISPRTPDKPTGGGTKALKKWKEKIEDCHAMRGQIFVCTDRPQCRLRRAKREYRKARLREKEQRRRECALRV